MTRRDGELDDLVAMLRQTEPRLDDMRRARLLQGIERRMDAPPARRRRWPFAAGLVVAAAVACVVAFRPRPAAPPAAILWPYVYTGGPATIDLLTTPQPRLDLPRGVVVRAELGHAGRLTLRGPARLSASQVGDLLELSIEDGCLLVDFDGTAGMKLRIRSPGAETLVTGTLFAVDVAGGQSSVVVARGKVTVRGARGEVQVGAGQGWSGAELAPAPPRLTALLEEHDGSVLPPKGEWGLVTLAGAPPDARASLGERALGETPLVARVPAGAAALRVESDALAPVLLGADVAEGKTSAVAYVLVPARPAPVPAPTPTPAPAPARERAAASAPAHAPARAPAAAPAPPPAREPAPAAQGPAPPVAAPASAEDLYRDAEAQMRAGRTRAARAVLARLVELHPDDLVAEAARYELARLAFQAGDLGVVDDQLAELRAGRDPALVEPAAYLRCRVAYERGQPSAAGCLADLRARFPRSSHDAEILALLAALRFRDGCAAAAPLLDEYLARYPTGRFARDAAARKARCR